jgi:hypothetical protein
MGLKQFFQRWSKGEDARAIAKAEDESRMTPNERDVDQGGFEDRKDDLLAGRTFAGEAARDVAADDLDA